MIEISNTAAPAHLGAYEARDVNQGLYLLAKDAGYKSFNQAVKKGAFDPAEMAIKQGATVRLWKGGRWVVSATL